jgi:arylsulfatase A-like enzyme
MTVLFVAFALTALACTATGAERPPNILLIVGDDMGFADVGFQGCKDIPTPNLDALAKSGVRFTNGYVSAPYCAPTRAGLLTGRYQQKFGFETNPVGPETGLPLTEKTIADRLKAHGYATALVGKWHLGAKPEMHPMKRGFAEFFGFLGGAHSYTRLNGIMRGTTPIDMLDYTTDAFGREAVSFINKHSGKPWFLYLAFNAVHTPLEATDARLAKFSGETNEMRRTYDAMMLALDEEIGAVLKAVDDSGQREDTLVFFISDNGGPTMKGTAMNGSRNGKLRGSKRTTLEGGIHVPYIVSWKNKVKPGAVFDEPVIQLDLTATALAAAGVDTGGATLDGVNLMPYLTGEKTGKPHDALYWRFGAQMAIRDGDFKLVRYDTNADTNTGKKGQPVSEAKLYNLKDDIGEKNDLASAMPEKVKEMQAKWDAWNATLAKPLWGGAGWVAGEQVDPDDTPKPAKKGKKKAAGAS